MVQAQAPTTGEQATQTDEERAQQTGLPGESQKTQAAEATEGAASEAAAGAASDAGFDFDSDEGIAKALETLPQLAARLERERRQAQDNGFNAGRQNRDKELRLERGSEATAKQYQQHLAEVYGVELSEADQREAPLWVKANRDAERVAYWQQQTEGVLDAFDVRERAQIEQHLQTFEGLPDQMEQLGRQVVDEAVKRQVSTRVSSLKLADIPDGSALHADIQRFIAEEKTKEAEAAALEAKQPKTAPPPRVPVGSGASQKTRADYAHLSDEQIADLPDEEYRIAMGYREG